MSKLCHVCEHYGCFKRLLDDNKSACVASPSGVVALVCRYCHARLCHRFAVSHQAVWCALPRFLRTSVAVAVAMLLLLLLLPSFRVWCLLLLQEADCRLVSCHGNVVFVGKRDKPNRRIPQVSINSITAGARKYEE